MSDSESCHRIPPGPSGDERDVVADAFDEFLTPEALKIFRAVARGLKAPDPATTLDTDDLVNAGVLKALSSRKDPFADAIHFRRYVVGAIYNYFFDYQSKRRAVKRNEGKRPTPLNSSHAILDDREERRTFIRAQLLEALISFERDDALLIVARLYLFDSLEECRELLGFSGHKTKKIWSTFRERLGKIMRDEERTSS